MPKKSDITRELTIAAPPEAVWRAITEASELVRWFSLDARTTPGVGGEIWISFGGPMEGAVRILEWEPNRHLRSVEGQVGERKPLTQDWHIEGEGGTTMLRFVHGGFDSGDWDDEYDSLLHGWAVFLSNLKCYLERHAGKPCVQNLQTFRPRLGRPEAFAAAVEALGDPIRIDGEPATVARSVAPVLLALDLGDWGRLNLSFEGNEEMALYATVLGWGVDAARVERAAAWLRPRLEAALPARG